MKNLNKSFVGFILAVLIVFTAMPFAVAVEDQPDYMSKIPPELQARMMSATDTELIGSGGEMMSLFISPTDLSGLHQEVINRIGTKIDWIQNGNSNDRGEYEGLYGETVLKVKSDLARAEATKFLNSVGFDPQRALHCYADGNIEINLTKDEIIQLAQDQRVLSFWYLNFGNGEGGAEEGGTYKFYTTEDALRILQAAVGKITWDYSTDFDVNLDWKCTAEDALLALQSAIGKIVIFWPAGTVFPE